MKRPTETKEVGEAYFPGEDRIKAVFNLLQKRHLFGRRMYFECTVTDDKGSAGYSINNLILAKRQDNKISHRAGFFPRFISSANGMREVFYQNNSALFAKCRNWRDVARIAEGILHDDGSDRGV